VVSDRAFGDAHRLGELRRRGRALAQEHHDARTRDTAERAQLLRVADDEDVVGFVVGED
jgi:hypothetical protein